MDKIIKSTLASNTEPKTDKNIEKLKDYPESINKLFNDLPNSLKNKLFSNEKEDIPFFLKSKEEQLGEIIKSFKIEDRERLMRNFLSELFNVANFRNILESINEDSLEQEIKRLFDLFWHSRGKRDNDVEIFNKSYYDNFFNNRKKIEEKIKEKKLEIKILKNSIEKTKKQIRLTEKKKEEMKKIINEESLLIKELEDFDYKNNNSWNDKINFSDVASRKRKEEKWTQALIIVSEHLDSTEFAIIIKEQIKTTFHKEFHITERKEKTYFGKKISEDEIERAKRVTELISSTIEKWYLDHENDDIFKEKINEDSINQQDKLINYFNSLASSYMRSRELKKDEAEMIYTIRQMEVSLNLLLKLHNKN